MLKKQNLQFKKLFIVLALIGALTVGPLAAPVFAGDCATASGTSSC